MAEMALSFCYRATLPRLGTAEDAKHLAVLGLDTLPTDWTSTLTWAQRPPERTGQRALPLLQEPGAVHFRRSAQQPPAALLSHQNHWA